MTRPGAVTLALLSIILAGVLFTIFFLYNDIDNRSGDRSGNAILDAVEPDSARRSPVHVELNEKLNTIQNLGKTVLAGITDDQSHAEYLATSNARRKELEEKVAPYAWEMTPVLLEEILEEQQPNEVWTEQVREHAVEVLEQTGSQDTSLVRVDCRENICRATQIHATEEAFEVFRDEMAVEAPWAGGESFGASEEIGDGRIRSDVYFTPPRNLDAFDEVLERIAEVVDRIEGGDVG
jgi:hypothetical protein